MKMWRRGHIQGLRGRLSLKVQEGTNCLNIQLSLRSDGDKVALTLSLFSEGKGEGAPNKYFCDLCIALFAV